MNMPICCMQRWLIVHGLLQESMHSAINLKFCMYGGLYVLH